jgi:NRAMP (natural resistance-associated macrophage protein)-like metal ion transporter
MEKHEHHHHHSEHTIRGAFGTIDHGSMEQSTSWKKKIATFFAILGPGLIVMVGDNDAGGISTYAQAGQNFGYSLLWVLPLLIPVLVLNQEMVVRLGAVTGAGHAKLLRERFGRGWAWFAAGDLLLLNFFTIATEFIGVGLSLEYFGISKYVSVPLAAIALVAMTMSGSFRRWERFMFVFVAANFLVIPLAFQAHPKLHEVVSAFTHPHIAGGETSTSVLLIVAIVGTTIAPWQLFFQQSNIVDKKITTRFVNYERVDTVLGSIVVVVAALLLIATVAAAAAGSSAQGHFTDGLGVANLIGSQISRLAGGFFAIILFNASLIGAAAVTLTTSYAIGDVLTVSVSLNNGWREAKGFYGAFAGLVGLAVFLILLPGAPLGLIVTAVQALAGILLPASTIFLLMLCNDRAVLGPWVNKPWLNAVATVVISILFALSFTLTFTTIFPSINVVHLVSLLTVVLVVFWIVAGIASLIYRRFNPRAPIEFTGRRDLWRMPPVALLERPTWTRTRRLAMYLMGAYLVTSIALLFVRAVVLATGGH